MILRIRKTLWTISFVVALTTTIIMLLISQTHAQRDGDICPPQEAILPCRCSSRGTELQIWCSHSDLPRVLNGLKNVAKVVNRPIDELILENNHLPSLPGRAFSPLKVLRLMLRHNGLERLSSGWLVDLENSLVEVYIVERELRSFPIDSLFGMRQLEAITIQSENLKRAPDFSGLTKLRYINIQSPALLELSQSFRDLISLETVHITGSKNLNRLESALFQDLPRLSQIDLSNNGINWLHLRALVGLPSLRELVLSGNLLNDAGMVGRSIKDLSNLEVLKIDHNVITVIREGSFVDLPGLKEIYLNDNAIAEIHHGAFHRIPNLKLVHFENNYIRRIHPESFLQPSRSGVDAIHLQNNGIDRVEELRSLLDTLPMLRYLDMSDNRLTAIPFGALRGHGTLEQLYLDNNNIRIVERDAFMAMPALRELRLKNNTLSDLLPMPFWNLPGLKGLDISYNRFRRLNPHLLAGLPSLRRLDISGNGLVTMDPAAFVNTPLVETLNISNNELVSIHGATFRDLDNLFEVDLSFNRLGDMISGLPKAVERVNLRNNKLHSLPLPPAPILELPKLRMLDVSSNAIKHIPRHLFKLMPQLRELNMAENQLQNLDEDSFLGLNRLEKLNLQDNEIINVHERSTVPLQELRELNMQGNRVQVLVDHILEGSCKIEKIDFSRNSLLEISPTAFRNAKTLQVLDLSSNNLKEIPEGLASLEDLREIDLSFNQVARLSPAVVSAWKNLEELRASNNKLPELQHGSFRSLPLLQYLDLSSNELQAIQPGAFRSLPELQEVVLADNKIVELVDHAFEDLPSLQAVHLQQNAMRSISPNAFFRSPSIVYLNLSTNNFKALENTGLRSVRNLEVLDLSNNGIKRISSSPLRGLDWLVELKLDDNRICGIKGEPFQTMPRLRVLSMRNNRMSKIPERTFRNLRSNIAILDVDGNPLDCSCEMLWYRAWLQETESHNPGPRCRDGSMLREARLSRSDCTNDGRSNQLPLANDHGDVFHDRHLDYDECESENLETYHNNLPPTPEESDYFYDQYVDYPNELNETFLATSNHSAPINEIPHGNKINNEEKVVDFNKNKFNNFGRPPPVPPQNNSPFTFFGVPIGSIGNIFGTGRNGKGVQSTTESMGTRGKGRVQIYKPGDPDFNQINRRPTESSDAEKTASSTHIERPDNKNDNNLFHRPYFQTPFLEPNVEQGGFTPMIPGSEAGFKPIHNPNKQNISNESAEETSNSSEGESSNGKRHSDWPDSFKERVKLLTEPPKTDSDEDESTTEPPTFNSKNIRPTLSFAKHPKNKFGSHEQSASIESGGESGRGFKHHNKIPLTTHSPKHSQVKGWTEQPKVHHTTLRTFTDENDEQDNQDNQDDEETDEELSKYEETDLDQKSPPSDNPDDNNTKRPQHYDDNFEQDKEIFDSSNNSPSSLSALVAPGAQQGIYRKSTIQKVFNPNTRNATVTAVDDVNPTLHSQHLYDNEFGSSHENPTQAVYSEANEEPIRREGMDWYFNNYNTTTDYNDYKPGLHNLKANAGCSAVKTVSLIMLLSLCGFKFIIS